MVGKLGGRQVIGHRKTSLVVKLGIQMFTGRPGYVNPH
jgi:hypothetical protein